MNNLEAEPIEPLLKAPQTTNEQQILHEELGPELEGLNYWTAGFNKITTEAFARVDDINSAGTKLPKWATTLQARFNSMRAEARPFQKHLIEDSETVDHSGVTERKHDSVGSIRDWYRSLGPTNEAEDLTFVLLGTVDTLEKAPESVAVNLLKGNILQDAALRIKDNHDKAKLLSEAVTSYRQAEQRGGLANPESRASFRHRLDCQHELLAQRYELGELSEDDFYRGYEKLQETSARALRMALDDKNEAHLGDGEALEWASLLFARHRFWSNQNAEQYQVRAALLREDQAIYPWRAEGGLNPIWSFDTVVTDRKTGEVKSRIQLKQGEFMSGSSRDRVYLPTVVSVVRSEKPPKQMRNLIDRGAKAVIESQKAMRMTDDELLKRIEIDQDAINTIEELFDKVLS